MAETGEERALNVEESLMHLLRVKTLAELNRVLSEPPDEKVLEVMGPPDAIYTEGWKQDRTDDAEIEQHAIEAGKKDGIEALFVTKDGETRLIWVPTPPPAEFNAFRHFSRLVVFSEPSDLDVYNIFWSAFLRRGNSGTGAIRAMTSELPTNMKQPKGKVCRPS